VVTVDVLILACLFAVEQWPLLKVREIIVEGPESWHARARELITLPADSNLFRVDRGSLERRLDREFEPLADSRVKLAVPGTIYVRLIPNPVALWTESGAGVSVRGDLLGRPADDSVVPVWRASRREGSRDHRFGALAAVAAWASVLDSDRRWREAVSEWTCDPGRGWEMTGADGKTKVILGWSAVQSRAYDVARLLALPDTLLARPCTIDARFDRYLIVRAQPDEEGVS
jgi:hypothetical protein